MKLFKIFLFLSAVHACEEIIIGNESIQPSDSYFIDYEQDCVQAGEEFEIEAQIKCVFRPGDYGLFLLSNIDYRVYITAQAIVFKLITGTGTIIFDVNKGDCVEGEYLDSRFALVKNGENWEQTLSINGELKDRLVSLTEPGHEKITLSYHPHFHPIIKKFAINDQPTKWSLPQTTSSLTTTSTPTTNCIGFEMLPTNLTASRRDAKRICRLLGGELPYFENQHELDLFESLRAGENRVDWLRLKENKRGIKFFVEKKEPEIFNWDENEPSGESRCVTANDVNEKWNTRGCEEKRHVTCKMESELYC
ncbi:unnamed protein product [Oikopleura dioica]|uniref:C-type lectin domain-containing protein n=1 Tax=Oikopleura dioica TaxID=34765 RepID=E4XLB2_OIKDI|nr:unnamed protein product [Oikopleura dioica]CBY15660.1 unnamed protein product [Oikopleura dioica]